MTPQKPDGLSALAADLLETLGASESGRDVILGGGVALNHYLPARATHDIDAWWGGSLSSDRVEAVEQIVQAVAARHGLRLQKRAFGDVVSFDTIAADAEHGAFSFQIASRTVQLDEPLESPWGNLRIETLRDNLASKMSALVHRGAPRDFVDVYRAVHSNVASVDDLWLWWQMKHPDVELVQAKAEVLRHLEALDARRPLHVLPDDDRDRAATMRRWYREQLVGPVLPDPFGHGPIW